MIKCHDFILLDNKRFYSALLLFSKEVILLT